MGTILRHPELKPETFHGIVTVAPEMLALFEKIRRAGRSDATVLIRGESGTGKELVSRALHACSARSRKPFRAVNCATFTAELLASELFGHVKGAFTGAIRDKSGLFVQADGGTLFLDEIAELPLGLQARLLRVIQERRFIPVGGVSETEVDVRIVSATNTGLRRLAAEGRFREDLMYRVRVVVLYLPTLKARSGDLEALTWHFIDEFNVRGPRRVHAIDASAWAAMKEYAWPGNIRELHNSIEQAFVLGDGPVLTLDELPPELVSTETYAVSLPASGPLDLKAVQRQQLLEAIRSTGGRRDRMAEALGISRATLYRRLKEHELI